MSTKVQSVAQIRWWQPTVVNLIKGESHWVLRNLAKFGVIEIIDFRKKITTVLLDPHNS